MSLVGYHIELWILYTFNVHAVKPAASVYALRTHIVPSHIIFLYKLPLALNLLFSLFLVLFFFYLFILWAECIRSTVPSMTEWNLTFALPNEQNTWNLNIFLKKCVPLFAARYWNLSGRSIMNVFWSISSFVFQNKDDDRHLWCRL